MKTIKDIFQAHTATCVVILVLLIIPIIISGVPMSAFYSGEEVAKDTSVNIFYTDLFEDKVESVQYDTGANSFLYWTTDNHVFCVKSKLVKEALIDTGVEVKQVSYVEFVWLICIILSIYFAFTIAKQRLSRTSVVSNNVFQSFEGSPQPSSPAKNVTSPSRVKDEKATTANKIKIDHVSFDDVAGYEETKKSLQFLVTCLSHPEKLEKIGSKMPTGVLLYGPPGTGKTMLAKAIACTAGVPFLYTSGSQFMEIYVGTGAKNIRSIYEQARKSAPCVVFIDEIDAIGCSRAGNNNDSERKHTLDALLVELDGINNNKGILTIAATNLLEDLDSALTRSGRFDRKIAVPLPNKDDRLAILKVHAKNKKLADDVNLEELATMTIGMAGADLAGVMNEAGIIALQNNSSFITRKHLETATLQIATGGEARVSDDKSVKRLVAYHEAGHAIAFKLIANQPVSRVTIVGSTSGVGGVTFGGSEEGSSFPSKKYMEDNICVCYAGRAAEALVFGEQNITVGASNDIKKATSMIRRYIMNFGMNKDLGLIDMDVLNNTQFASATDEKVVREARALSATLYQKTLDCLVKNRTLLDVLASELMRVGSLNDKELNKLFARHEKKEESA